MSFISDAIGTVIGPGRLYAELAVAGALVVGLGTQTWRLHSAETGEAKAVADKAEYIATAASSALTASQQNRATEAQRTKDQKEASDEAQRMSIHARDDSSSARAALAGLLERARAGPGSSQAASNPVDASIGAPAEGAGLRTDLLSSVGGEAVRYAAIADVARIGRGKCEADYGTLNVGTP